MGVVRWLVHAVLAALTFLVPLGLVTLWVMSARGRLEELEAKPVDVTAQAAVAQAADAGYCSPELKKILRRVLQSCGLSTDGAGRGCQPTDAKAVAALSGSDFNALFLPLADRAAILQYDSGKGELDDGDRALLDKVFADQGGGSYFFVVSRASPDGDEVFNRELSQARGQAVLDHLRSTFNDPNLDQEVGLLWLGEEFAQLDDTFCNWKRSGDGDCNKTELNRSAFVAWIDCRL